MVYAYNAIVALKINPATRGLEIQAKEFFNGSYGLPLLCGPKAMACYISRYWAHSWGFCLFVCLVFSCIDYFYYHCDQNAWKKHLTEGRISFGSQIQRGLSVVFGKAWWRQPLTSGQTRKQEAVAEVGTDLCSLVSCPIWFDLCFQPIQPMTWWHSLLS